MAGEQGCEIKSDGCCGGGVVVVAAAAAAAVAVAAAALLLMVCVCACVRTCVRACGEGGAADLQECVCEGHRGGARELWLGSCELSDGQQRHAGNGMYTPAASFVLPPIVCKRRPPVHAVKLIACMLRLRVRGKAHACLTRKAIDSAFT